ncbi:MAG: hypothetical protein ACI35R_12090 [Bacillus sp. (in: firmicutes)]
MAQDKILGMERLVGDLIKLTAKSHVKVCSYEEQVQQLEQQVIILEKCLLALLEKEKMQDILLSHHRTSNPAASQLRILK